MVVTAPELDIVYLEQRATAEDVLEKLREMLEQR